MGSSGHGHSARLACRWERPGISRAPKPGRGSPRRQSLRITFHPVVHGQLRPSPEWPLEVRAASGQGSHAGETGSQPLPHGTHAAFLVQP